MNDKYQAAEKMLDHANEMLDNGYDSFTVYNKIDAQLLTIGLNEYDLRRYRERLKAITGVRAE